MQRVKTLLYWSCRLFRRLPAHAGHILKLCWSSQDYWRSAPCVQGVMATGLSPLRDPHFRVLPSVSKEKSRSNCDWRMHLSRPTEERHHCSCPRTNHGKARPISTACWDPQPITWRHCFPPGKVTRSLPTLTQSFKALANTGSGAEYKTKQCRDTHLLWVAGCQNCYNGNFHHWALGWRGVSVCPLPWHFILEFSSKTKGPKVTGTQQAGFPSAVARKRLLYVLCFTPSLETHALQHYSLKPKILPLAMTEQTPVTQAAYLERAAKGYKI